MALRDRVNATIDPALRDDEAYVRVTLKNGEVLKRHVEHAIGSLYRPMSNADLDAKFRGLTADILSREEADRLLNLCWNVEALSEVADIARATIPSSTKDWTDSRMIAEQK